MAILKMKKLRLIAVRSNKEELLRELIRHGCVEISELEGELHGTDIEALVHRESSDVASLKSRHTTLTHAIDLLDHYAPKKGKLLSAKPELDDRVLLDDTGLAGALKVAEGIESYDARIKRISAEESRQRGVIQSLQPWLDLDLPLGTEGTERCAVLLGTIPARTEPGQVEAALEQIDAESELFCVHEEKKEHYVVFVCMREKLAEMQECLRGFGFSAASFAGVSTSAKECSAEAHSELQSLATEKENCVQYIVGEAVRRDELKLAADRVSVQISLAEAGDKLYGTDSAVIMEGWYPEEREAELNEVFELFGCAWEALVPEEDEYPNVPVKLKNNKITNALNIAMILGSDASINLNVTGGEFKPPTLSLTGMKAANYFTNIHADKVFLATAGINLKTGLTYPSISDLVVKKAMIEASDPVSLVADSSKIGTSSFASLGALSLVDHIITDSKISTEDEKLFQRFDVRYTVAQL